MVTGRTRDEALAQLTQRYASRVQHYVPFEIVELPDVRTTRATTEAAQKQAEGAQMLKNIHPSDYVVLLDETRHLKFGIEFLEYATRYVHSSQNSFFLHQKMLLAHFVGANGREGSMIAIADIFGKSQGEQVID